MPMLSCRCTHSAISARMAVVVAGLVQRAAREAGAGGADLRGLGEGADGGGRQRRQVEAGLLRRGAGGVGAGAVLGGGAEVERRRPGVRARRSAAMRSLAVSASATAASPSSMARASVATSASFPRRRRGGGAARGRARSPRRRLWGTCSSEQEGATIRRRAPPGRSAAWASRPRAARRSVRQTLRPSTTPSESHCSGLARPSAASSWPGSRTRSRWTPAPAGRRPAPCCRAGHRSRLPAAGRGRGGLGERREGGAVGSAGAGRQVGHQAGLVDLHPGGAGLGHAAQRLRHRRAAGRAAGRGRRCRRVVFDSSRKETGPSSTGRVRQPAARPSRTASAQGLAVSAKRWPAVSSGTR